MLNYRIRHYLEVAYIIKNEKVLITEFQAYFMLSDYELKNDWKKLKEMENFFGVRFLDHGESITYKILNQSIFNQKQQLCVELYYRHYNNPQAAVHLIHSTVISLMLLSSGRREISVDHIAAELNYSKSSLRRSIKWARDFLEGYNIKIQNVPRHGLYVTGNEFYQRLCLVALTGFVNPRILIGLNKDLIFNEANPQLAAQIEKVMHQLSPQEVQLFSTNSLRIIKNYLIISQNRIHRGFFMNLWEDPTLEVLKQTWEAALAKKLFQELGSLDEITSEEISALAILILILKEYVEVEESGYENFALLFENKTKELTQKIQDFFEHTLHCSIKEPLFLDALHNSVSKLVLRDHFEMLRFKAFNLSGRSFAMSKDPLLLEMKDELLALVKQEFQTEIRESQMVEVMDIFQRYIQSLPLQFQRCQIKIISSLSLVDNMLLRENIIRCVPSSLYESIQIISRGSETTMTPKENEVYIVDQVLHLGNHPRFYVLDQHFDDIRNLSRFILMNGHVSTSAIQSVQSCAFTTVSEIPEWGNASSKSIICNGIQFQLIPVEKPCNAELFLCQYSSSQPLPDSLKSRSIVIIKYYPTQANLRLIDSLLVLLANDELFYEDLRTNPDLGTLDSYLSHWL